MLSLQELQQLREERGLQIVNSKNPQIEKIDVESYQVLSRSGNGSYLVALTKKGWLCECPDFKFRGLKCKHIWAVEFSLKLREEVKKETVIQQIAISECIYCHSQNLKKNGIRKNKYGDIQRFFCYNCRKTTT